MSPTLSQFWNQGIYISSFRLSQRDIFESVKLVTKTTDTECTIKHDETEYRYEEGLKAAMQSHSDGWIKMGYSRMFLPDGAGDYESSQGLHNADLGLGPEGFDTFTAIGVQMGLDSGN